MNYLNDNMTAYNDYFKWKENVVFTGKPYKFSPICNICIFLHLEDFYGVKKQVITDLNKFWSKKQCQKN